MAQKSHGSIWFFGTKLMCAQYLNRPIPADNLFFLATFGLGKSLSPKLLDGYKKEDEIIGDARAFYSVKPLFLKVLATFGMGEPQHLSRSWPHCIECLTPKKYMTHGAYCSECYYE
jgi:hypothetical protein